MTEGKIIKALSGFYYVQNKSNEIIQCRGRGVFRKKNITPLVGDYVFYQPESNQEGFIMEIKERKNELVRPPIANVDQALLVFSATSPVFNPTLLDKFLVMIEAKHIEPIIIISKMDLVDDKQLSRLQEYLKQYETIGYKVLKISSKMDDWIKEVTPILHNKISVLAGQSGVGKSTLLNKLNPHLQLETNIISDSLGRGKHTTRHVELIAIGKGYVADTPGFSAIDFEEIEAEELTFYFPEMKELINNCKFRGCSHTKEPKCAVKEAVDAGTIARFRYENYLAFLQEIKDRKPRYER